MRLLAALAALAVVLVPSAAADSPSISVTDQTWVCNAPVVEGTLVTVNFTSNFPGRAVDIRRNCTGNGDLIPDLKLDIKGDGLTHGPQDDAIRITNYQRETSQGLVITGHADCGNRQGTNFHQDGMQQLGGNGITFLNFEIGDYDGQQATCQSAGGTIFYSLPGVDIDVIGGKFIGCNVGLRASGDTSPGSEIRDASFRSGHAPDDPVCAPYFSGDACHISPEFGGDTSNLTCEEWPFPQPPPPPSPPICIPGYCPP